MNYRKAKGTLHERSLKHLLEEKGFFVVRASGSGADGVSPDLIALHTTKKLAFECKAWKNSLHLEKKKIEIMLNWQAATGIPFFVAWKVPHKEWRFFPITVLNETDKGYSLSLNDAHLGMTLEDVLK